VQVKLQGELTVQEILCWVGLVVLAANPVGTFDPMIEAVGMRTPLALLAIGAGFKHVKSKLGGKN
jgi:hypothetical protein